MDKRKQRILEGAKNYAAFDRSDPFALARCMLHIRNGIAGVIDVGPATGEDAIYSADPFRETRHLPSGEAYFITVFRNIKRP